MLIVKHHFECVFVKGMVLLFWSKKSGTFSMARRLNILTINFRILGLFKIHNFGLPIWQSNKIFFCLEF